jgi:hypothetical protein
VSATTTQLLSSGEFCKLRYDTIPVKSASATIPITKKCQILSFDTIVANERNVHSIVLEVNCVRFINFGHYFKIIYVVFLSKIVKATLNTRT